MGFGVELELTLPPLPPLARLVRVRVRVRVGV